MEKVFALDIGTRVVIGVIMLKTENGYDILASSRAEHSQRAMYDGQVHDVKEVTKAVLKVKNELEQKTGESLKNVAVAAAGRALRTEIGQAIRHESYPIEWKREDIIALEMEALQNAIIKTTSSKSNQNFYCVGYSVLKQVLEDQDISSLVGQRGQKAEITIIATFLPRTVVDGLFSVLEHCGLEMDRLTLEPIAAGQAAIPSDMRRLNLALVDIGAGTSDIAITKEGSFTSFGMVPIAGDEITEKICEYFLLEFEEGERVKKQLINKNEEIEIINFFGEKQIILKQQILELIKPTIKNLAEKIHREIVQLNQNIPPQAIILVGGGSQIPFIKEFLAELFKLSINRIGIQSRERLHNVRGEEKILIGADVITPLGIGMAALEGNSLHYYSVTVNNTLIPIFEFHLATVAEALIAAGIHPRTFVGCPGKALVYFLNGEMRILKGELGNPAKIFINGKQANLEQKVNSNDSIEFVPGRNGNDAKAQVKDIVSLNPPKKIYWNGIEEEFKPLIYIDGVIGTDEDWLKDGCKLEIQDNTTLYDLLKYKDIDLESTRKKVIKIQGKLTEVFSDVEIRLNGELIKDNCLITEYDKIVVTERKTLIKDLQLEPKPLIFYVNGEELQYKARNFKIYNKGKVVSLEDPVEDGMDLIIEESETKLILSDIFPYLNLEKSVTPGGKLMMLVNNKEAAFTTEINPGDNITIHWISK